MYYELKDLQSSTEVIKHDDSDGMSGEVTLIATFYGPRGHERASEFALTLV